MRIGRRDFMRVSALAATLGALPAPAATTTRNGMPHRRLGKTGENVSLLGVGGAHIGLGSVSEAEAIRMMRHAVDEGVNFFDNAWDYSNGRSEERMGKALKDGYREKVFLMTKVLARDRQGAQAQLEASLRRLDVDTIDLWQMHSVKFEDDPREVYEDGPLDVAIEAQKAGKIRYIGFTGHYVTSAHLEMIRRGFDWDTVQMPLSILDYHFESFTREVIPKAQEKDMGIIAMKTLAGGRALRAEGLTVEDALQYSMNLPISTLVCGMTSMDMLRENIAIAKRFEPLEPEDVARLRTSTEQAGNDGQLEAYKTQWY